MGLFTYSAEVYLTLTRNLMETFVLLNKCFKRYDTQSNIPFTVLKLLDFEVLSVQVCIFIRVSLL